MNKTQAEQFQRTYTAEPAQVGSARRALAQALDGHPAADDATLVASEFAANAVLLSASRDGREFTLRAEITARCVHIEVSDRGGLWQCRAYRDGRPHGLSIVDTITRRDWGIYSNANGRTAWARITT